jgi:hypothetical protein
MKKKPVKRKAKKKPAAKRKRSIKTVSDDPFAKMTPSDYKRYLDRRIDEQVSRGKPMSDRRGRRVTRPHMKEVKVKETFESGIVGEALIESAVVEWFGRPAAVRKITRKDSKGRKKVEWFAGDVREHDLPEVKKKFEALKKISAAKKKEKAKKKPAKISRSKKRARKAKPKKKK